MATPNYNINYDDKRFTEVEADKKAALTDVEKTYGGMVNESDKYYQAQINATEQWGKTQQKNQQAMTDFTIEQINQQKDQAHKDYIKEQSGAYADWQKQSNQYGANAEQVAAQGLANTGYSESSQVAMYNQYQNRVATAREVFNRAVLDYDNDIKEARLQNSSKLAEIAYNTLQKKLELGLQGFQYKNQLIIEQSNQKLKVDEMHYNRYQDVLEQINAENTLKEQIRQHEQNYALKEKEYAEGVRQFNAELQLQQERFAEEKRQFNVAQAAKDAAASGTKSATIKKSSTGKGVASAGSSGINKTSSSKSSSNNTPKVNMQSVLDLGLGPISEERLDSLVRSGTVKEYEKDGQLYYRYVIKLG